MYAVIKTGGKQYRVREGDTLRIESLAVDAGGEVRFDEVLLVGEGDSVKVGTPRVAGASVVATVAEHGRGDKVTVQKFKRRQGYKRLLGHRQAYTEIRITGIQAG